MAQVNPKSGELTELLAEKEQTLIPIHPQRQQRQRQNQQFEGRDFDYFVGLKTGRRYFREPRVTRRQHLHLHLQLRSCRLRNAKRVGTHGNLHLRHGGDFGFLERIPENQRGAQTGHPLTMHICAVQFVHTRGTHKQRAWLKGQHGSRIALSSLCS